MLLTVCGALLLGAPARAQYWDRQGLALPPPRAPPARGPLAARLLEALLAVPYGDSAGDDDGGPRARRRAPEPGVPPARDKERGGGGGGGRMAVVGKCCPVGQNLSEETHGCAPSTLALQPIFFDSNGSGYWDYDVNEWETIVGDPCPYGKYVLQPGRDSKDEFYLLRNGSLFAPYHVPPVLPPRDFCVEAFWVGGEPLTLPLVCFQSEDSGPSARDRTWLACISILMLVSVPFLVVTCCAHWLREVRALVGEGHARVLAAYSGCLAAAYLALASTQLASPGLPPALCVPAAHAIQFTFLASFFWLNLLCWETYCNIEKRLSPTSGVHSDERGCARAGLPPVWLLWGWGAPAIITLLTLLLDSAPGLPLTLLRPNFGAAGCWFQNDVSTLAYFYGPVSVLLGANIVLFALSAYSLARQRAALPLAELGDALAALGAGPEAAQPLGPTRPRAPPTRSLSSIETSARIFRLCLVLFLVMGLSWLLEVVSWLAGGPGPLWYCSDLINAIQGIIICIIFVRPAMFRLLWRKIAAWVLWIRGQGRGTSSEAMGVTSVGRNGSATSV